MQINLNEDAQKIYNKRKEDYEKILGIKLPHSQFMIMLCKGTKEESI